MKYAYFSIFFILFLTFSCNQKEEEVKYKATLSASSEYNEHKVETLLDSDPNTYWNSSQSGQNWINLKFEKNYTISKILFVASVSPPSSVRYDVMVLDNQSSEYKNVHSDNFFCNGNNEITISKELKNVRDLRIIFNNDSSWMCVKSLSVIGKENFF